MADRDVAECAVDDSSDVDESFVLAQRAEKITAERQRHSTTGILKIQQVVPFHFSPMFLPLTLSHKDSCVALENAAFTNPNHRCTPEKFEYRLTKCTHLCFGVFCSITPEQIDGFQIETVAAAKPVETGRQDGALQVLCAHIIATMGKHEVVTDDDMNWPRDWKNPASTKTPDIGHQEDGRTVCLHSFAVAPRLQGCGIGKMAMMSYLQVINDSGMADRVALIAQTDLVTYYKKFGFKHLGESKAQFGGGGWHDMVFELAGPANKKK